MRWLIIIGATIFLLIMMRRDGFFKMLNSQAGSRSSANDSATANGFSEDIRKLEAIHERDAAAQAGKLTVTASVETGELSRPPAEGGLSDIES